MVFLGCGRRKFLDCSNLTRKNSINIVCKKQQLSPLLSDEAIWSLSTLDVVVEGTVSIPVFVEDAEGVAVGKILKLYQAVHPIPAGR